MNCVPRFCAGEWGASTAHVLLLHGEVKSISYCGARNVPQMHGDVPRRFYVRVFVSQQGVDVCSTMCSFGWSGNQKVPQCPEKLGAWSASAEANNLGCWLYSGLLQERHLPLVFARLLV